MDTQSSQATLDKRNLARSMSERSFNDGKGVLSKPSPSRDKTLNSDGMRDALNHSVNVRPSPKSSPRSSFRSPRVDGNISPKVGGNYWTLKEYEKEKTGGSPWLNGFGDRPSRGFVFPRASPKSSPMASPKPSPKASPCPSREASPKASTRNIRAEDLRPALERLSSPKPALRRDLSPQVKQRQQVDEAVETSWTDGLRSPPQPPRKSPQGSPRASSPRAKKPAGSPRVTEDHLWRELLHDKSPREESKSKLSNEGAKFSWKNQSSDGIPWRNMPTFDKTSGSMSCTGDHPGSANTKNTQGMPMRKKSPFSQKHASGGNMRNVLCPVQENAPPFASEASIENGDERYRPIRKVNVAANASPTKESCPYHREDSQLSEQAAPWWAPHSIQGSPSVQRLTAPLGGREAGGYRFETSVANFEASLRGGPTQTLVLKDEGFFREAEKVPEARRDYRFIQEKPILETVRTSIAPQWLGMSKSPSQQSLGMRTSISVHSLGSQASQMQAQMSIPIHSVRVRVPAEGLPGKSAWKY